MAMPVVSTRGLVCSASPLAASTGRRVLADGGSAFDVAIAVAAVECVTMPARCGIGGEAFAVLYHAATGKAYGLTSTGPAPEGASAALYKGLGHAFVPYSGPLAASPPGEVAAYQLISDTFGTRSLGTLLEPAIGYAEEGFHLPPGIGHDFVNGARRLAESPSTAATFLKSGKPYGTGDLFANKGLGRALRRIAERGAEEFYRGGLARDIVKAFQEAGGLIDEASMAAVQAELYEPLTTTYRGYLVAENRPPSQGAILLEMLNIVEGYDPAGLGSLSPEGLHLMIEAKKLAFADRNRYLADPLVESVPLERLVSKEHAARRRALIDPNRALGQVEAADLQALGTDTSYFCVADGEGNAVSFIHSVYAPWGSAFVAGDTGILLNNRQRGFRLEEGHPNGMAAGKRPMHTLNAYIVFKGGRPFLVGGTPGADLQVQANLQVISGVIDQGIAPQMLVEAPRWFSRPGSDPPSLDDPFEVLLGGGMPSEVWAGLAARGHVVKGWPDDVNPGLIQLIQIEQGSGAMTGASDPRGDGQAVGL